MELISFNELRRIKNSLPPGSTERIARELNIDAETVRNYFGGTNYKDGHSVGLHIEKGPDGGLVKIDDPTILNCAKRILGEM
ncbi:MAG: DNA-binding protein [Rikenellaceae bacterium]|nr:DNA-binding protein [Rikenellaceae bacterium]